MVMDGLMITQATLFQLRYVLDEEGYLRLSKMLSEQQCNNTPTYCFTDENKFNNTNTKGYSKSSYTRRG